MTSIGMQYIDEYGVIWTVVNFKHLRENNESLSKIIKSTPVLSCKKYGEGVWDLGRGLKLLKIT